MALYPNSLFRLNFAATGAKSGQAPDNHTPRQGLRQLVPGRHPVRRPGRAGRGGQGVHGDQAARVRHLGEDPRCPGHTLQGDGPQERLLPPVHPQELPAEGGRACGGVRARAGRGHPRGRQGAGGAVRGAPHQRDNYRALLRQVDQQLAGSAAADQPVGQRGALGAAHPHVPAHVRVPVAGGAHGPRLPRGGRGGDPAHARRVRRVRGGAHGHARAQGREDREREVRRGGAFLLHRGDDAERVRAAGGHQP